MTLLERVIGDAFFAAELAEQPLSPRQKEIVQDVVLGMLADNLCEVLMPGGAPGERIDSQGRTWYSSRWLNDRIAAGRQAA